MITLNNWEAGDVISLYDYLGSADPVHVEAEDMAGPPDSPLWARLVLRTGRAPLPRIYHDPTFVYTEEGWKFSTFFMHL
jgi:hypothetical protein